MPKAPRLIIFDCDGVLVHSEGMTIPVIAERLALYGQTLTTDEAAGQFIGGTIASIADRARSAGIDLPEDWVEGTYAAMLDKLSEGCPLIPHLDQVFEAIDRTDIQTCICSNGPMKKMQITLPQANLWDRFEGRIFSAHDVGIAKPDPGLLWHAAEVFGVSPEECVVIEDSGSGAKAAQAAGMRCYGYTADTPAERLTAHGAIPFASMAELPALMGLK